MRRYVRTWFPRIAAILGATACTFAHAAHAHANAVYKCRNADGLVVFQDVPCAGTGAQSRVDIPPPPPPSPSPDYGHPSPATDHVRPRIASATRRNVAAQHEVVSYECRATNGDVFYRHGACPRQISATGAGANGRKRSAGGAGMFAVSAEPLSRDEACRRMASAGSIGRAGHERDETVSTYDRNLGRDPCRYF